MFDVEVEYKKLFTDFIMLGVVERCGKDKNDI